MPNYAAPADYVPRTWSPYLSPPPTTVAPPTTTTPGRPLVGTHSGGGCGCGGGCGGTAIATPEPVTLGGKAPSLSSAGTGSGVKVPNLSGDTTMFQNIDWARDWWKFVAGAVAYRLLAK